MTETTNKDISSKIKKQDAPASIFKDFYGAIGTVLGGIKETIPSVKEAIEEVLSR